MADPQHSPFWGLQSSTSKLGSSGDLLVGTVACPGQGGGAPRSPSARAGRRLQPLRPPGSAQPRLLARGSPKKGQKQAEKDANVNGGSN